MADRADESWFRHGALVTTRFRALGVRSPDALGLAFCRSIEPGIGGLSLLVASTRAAFTDLGGPLDPEAARTTFANVEQIRHVLQVADPDRLALLLQVVDGIDPDGVARLLERTSPEVQQILRAEQDVLEGLATPMPPGSQPDGHPTTATLHGFVLEHLAADVSGRIEQHLASCAFCFARFEAWSSSNDAFTARPAPPPPPAPPSAVPRLMLMAALLLLAFIVGAGGVGFILLQSAQIESAAAFRGEPAVIHVQTGGTDAIPGVIPTGAILLTSFDGRGAAHAAVFVRGEGPPNLVLFQGPLDGRARHEVPAELIYSPEQHRAVYVMLADTPIDEALMQAGVAGENVEPASIAMFTLTR